MARMRKAMLHSGVWAAVFNVVHATLFEEMAAGNEPYDASVPAYSRGSNNHISLDLDQELEYVQYCLWTIREVVEPCKLNDANESECFRLEIIAHHLQRQLLDHYKLGTAPPLEECTVVVQGRMFIETCKGLLLTCALLVLEVTLQVNKIAPTIMSMTQELMYRLAQDEEENTFTRMMFPIQEAFNRANAVHAAVANMTRKTPTVHVVIARCDTRLMWLWNFDFPHATIVFIYEKCNATDTLNQASGLVNFVVRQMPPDRGLMTGECTAYLTHIILEWGNLPDYIIFLHDDGPRHLKPSFLNMALRLMATGLYNVPFLHLAHERYAQQLSPCMAQAYHIVLGRKPSGLLSSYCCSHFIVSKERIEAPGFEMYLRLRNMIYGGNYTTWGGGSCKVGRKPCYLMEFLWHIVFGEEDSLPMRSSDQRLPVSLRYEGGRFNDIPSGIRVSSFTDMFESRRVRAMLNAAHEKRK